jgi:hypothetical protein
VCRPSHPDLLLGKAHVSDPRRGAGRARNSTDRGTPWTQSQGFRPASTQNEGRHDNHDQAPEDHRLSVGALAAGLMMTGGATPASATPTPTQSTGVAASAQPPGLMLPAACAQWSIALLRIQQSNGWQMFIYRDAQKGSEIRGNARADEMRGGGILIGDVEGSVRGNVVDFTASWTNGSFGRYVGSIDNDGFTSGTTRDKAYKVTATWRLLRRAMCVQR